MHQLRKEIMKCPAKAKVTLPWSHCKLNKVTQIKDGDKMFVKFRTQGNTV